ncbi:hypothetical protein F2Q70_00035841 [Brassica cretica]|uniref:Uncharacterized protein n=1 Tax=Brassica cretica TaxID=69181 RepID=A0A8S9GH49_BRACR|nr:hypothetical protein F2Q68_00031065 [Brassica cretica]KAF2585208.1 hypothetical protein F2Q70_00035841 [Brassica cretica]
MQVRASRIFKRVGRMPWRARNEKRFDRDLKKNAKEEPLRNEKRFDRDSKKNAKEEPLGAGPTHHKASWRDSKEKAKEKPLGAGPTRYEASKSNSTDCELDVVHPTCFYRKMSTETPIEMKRKLFRPDFKRERKAGAVGGLSNCPTHRTGELDDSFGPTRPFGDLDWSNSPNGRVGR